LLRKQKKKKVPYLKSPNLQKDLWEQSVY